MQKLLLLLLPCIFRRWKKICWLFDYCNNNNEIVVVFSSSFEHFQCDSLPWLDWQIYQGLIQWLYIFNGFWGHVEWIYVKPKQNFESSKNSTDTILSKDRGMCPDTWIKNGEKMHSSLLPVRMPRITHGCLHGIIEYIQIWILNRTTNKT